jgi:hypothetical protein
MKSRLFLPACFVAALSFSNLHAQGSSAGVHEFDPKKFPGTVVDDVVVPVPSEIFSVLDKLGEPNWRQELRKLGDSGSSDRTALSLRFGSVVAEGFVAVQAQDKQAVEDIGREVIDLSKSLGISKAVIPHANSILDAVDKNDWSTIRKEFDRTQTTVRNMMEQNKDADLSQCVSIGGWLRGTAAVTSIVGKNFSEDRAELLNQPALVDHFIGSIGRMGGESKNKGVVRSIADGLKTVRDKMASGSFTSETVNAIGKTCNGLLDSINGK